MQCAFKKITVNLVEEVKVHCSPNGNMLEVKSLDFTLCCELQAAIQMLAAIKTNKNMSFVTHSFKPPGGVFLAHQTSPKATGVFLPFQQEFMRLFFFGGSSLAAHSGRMCPPPLSLLLVLLHRLVRLWQ